MSDVWWGDDLDETGYFGTPGLVGAQPLYSAVLPTVQTAPVPPPVTGVSSADAADVKRYCGYPVAASMGAQILPVQGYAQQVDLILSALTADQVGVLQAVYLTNLRLLEADIPGTRDGLDTAKAAVFTRNPAELQERMELFATWRRQLCFFLGVPPGDGIIPLVPGVFVI